MWQDEWFSSLSRAGKLVFIYLVTNRNIGMSGIYELPDRVICFDTGINQSEIDSVKKELSGKVSFFKDWIFVVNSTRYNTFKGEKLEVAKGNEVSQVPSDVKKMLVKGKDDRVSIPHRYPSDTSISSPININISKGSNKDYMESTSLTDSLVSQISKQKNISVTDGKKIRDRLLLYCESSGKTYKNYKATLEMWIMRGVDEGKTKQLKINGGSIAEAFRKAGRNDI